MPDVLRFTTFTSSAGCGAAGFLFIAFLFELGLLVHSPVAAADVLGSHSPSDCTTAGFMQSLQLHVAEHKITDGPVDVVDNCCLSCLGAKSLNWRGDESVNTSSDDDIGGVVDDDDDKPGGSGGKRDCQK